MSQYFGGSSVSKIIIIISKMVSVNKPGLDYVRNPRDCRNEHLEGTGTGSVSQASLVQAPALTGTLSQGRMGQLDGHAVARPSFQRLREA